MLSNLKYIRFFGIIILGFIIITGTPSCFPEEEITLTILDTGININNGGGNNGNNNPVATIAYIYDDNIYTMNTRGENRKQITSRNDAYENVTLSRDRSKIAYFSGSSKYYPVIVDTSGNILAELKDKVGARFFRWSADSKTLYYLYNNKLEFWGPDGSLTKYFPGVINNYYSFDISRRNEIAITESGFSGTKVYYINSSSSTGQEVEQNLSNTEFSNVLFNGDATKMYLVYSGNLDEYDIQKDNLREIDLYYINDDLPTSIINISLGFNEDNSEIYIEDYDDVNGYYIKVLDENWNQTRQILIPTGQTGKLYFDVK